MVSDYQIEVTEIYPYIPIDDVEEFLRLIES